MILKDAYPVAQYVVIFKLILDSQEHIFPLVWILLPFLLKEFGVVSVLLFSICLDSIIK